jgi:DNA uptake protein ComE-like DNA-binding protein
MAAPAGRGHIVTAKRRQGEITMRLNRYLAVIGISTLLALPAVAQTGPPSKSPSPSAAAAPSAMGKSAARSDKTSDLVDINSAGAEELDKLPGIGPARAKAIIAHRPYGGKDDLVQRKVIPPNIYNQIKDKVIARQK